MNPLTLLFFTSPLVTCRNIHNTIGIDVEGDFNLWHTSGCRRDANLWREDGGWIEEFELWNMKDIMKAKQSNQMKHFKTERDFRDSKISMEFETRKIQKQRLSPLNNASSKNVQIHKATRNTLWLKGRLTQINMQINDD